MEDRPIFIAGPDRSGTTLLYALLASHPNISMVRRMNYWRWFNERYGDLNVPENFERLLDRLLHYKRIKRLDPDGERIRNEFLQGEHSYARLIAILLRQNAEKAGKPRWGDKSLHTEHYADLAFSQFPQAKIIHMTRDPRDRYASVRKRFGKDSPRLAAATGRWLNSMKAALRNQKNYPERYLIVRYEDLAAYPEETSRKICQFIGEVYSPEMLTMAGETEYRNSGGNSSFNKIQPGTISTRSIGRYHEVLSPYETLFIQRFSDTLMLEFNYPLDDVQLSVLQKIKYFTWFLPYHYLRMRAWKFINFILCKRKAPPPANRFLDGRTESNLTLGGSHVKPYVQ